MVPTLTPRFRKLVKRRIIENIIFLVVVMIIWKGAGFIFGKSGYFYQKGIIRALNSTYESKFKFISEEGTNEDGYEIIKVSPLNDPDLVFTATRENGHIDGGLPTWRRLTDTYKIEGLKKYYPLLVKKHFGIEIHDVPRTIYSGVDTFEKPSDENYIEVTRANLDDMISKSKAFFKDAEGYRLNKLLFRFKDDMNSLPEDVHTRQRFELLGFEFERGEHWSSGFRPLTEKEIREAMIRTIGKGIAERMVNTFEAENPDWERTLQIKFLYNDLTSYEASITDHTPTLEQREEALAIIYQAFTKVMPFVDKLPELQMTAIHLKYKTNLETETVTLQKEDWESLSSLSALKELFKHSTKTSNPR